MSFLFSPHRQVPQSLFPTNLFSGAAAANPSPDLLCSSGTGCPRDYRLLSGGDRMLRGWGARAGTQAWNARLDPAVGWLSPLPRPPPPHQPPGAQVNRETACFQEQEARKGHRRGEKTGVRWWRGRGEGRGEVSGVLAAQMTAATPSCHCSGSGPNSPDEEGDKPPGLPFPTATLGQHGAV